MSTERLSTRISWLLLFSAFALAGCTKHHPVSLAIDTQANKSDAQLVRLADATAFEWDQVYLFDPYKNRADICAMVKIPASDCTRQLGSDLQGDGEMSLAFMSRGRLVHYVRHLRSQGDFTPAPEMDRQPIATKDAVFRVVRTSARGRTLVLE